MGGGIMAATAAATAAARVAVIGAVNGGFRIAAAAVAPAPAVENLLRSASVKSPPIVSAIASPSVCDADDWELSSSNNDRLVFSPQLPAKIISAGHPTIQEAKSAIDDINSALDGFSDIQCIVIPGSQSNAFDAFKMLKENPIVQDVVASIASDPNVWEAVMKNPALLQFIHSETNYGSDGESERSEGNGVMRFLKKMDSSNDMKSEGNGVMWFLKKMMDLLNDMWHSVFSKCELLGNKACSFMASEECKYFSGLALIVIMLLVLKKC